MRGLGIGWLLGICAVSGHAQPVPEDCLPKAGEAPAFEAEHAGRTYGFVSAECREQFRSDPERYAQLYDAILQLRERGKTPERPATDSLVPS